MKKVYNLVRRVSNLFSHVSKWLLIALIVVICFDVFMRYVLSKPTIWAYDTSYILGAVICSFSFATLHLDGGNVRVDIFYSKFSRKGQLIIDIVLNLLVYLPAYILLTNAWIKNTYKTFVTKELITQTMWRPLFWPVNGIITLGFLLFTIAFVMLVILDILEIISLDSNKKKEGAIQ